MRIVRIAKVRADSGYSSDTSVYSNVRTGLFTVPVRIGQRAVGWPEHEVEAINAARIAGRTDDQIRELVDQLHQARMAGTGEPFKTDWFDRSKAQKHRIAKRKQQIKAVEAGTGVAAK